MNSFLTQGADALKGLSITGNVWMDGYLVTTIMSCAVAYCTSVVSWVKNTLHWILELTATYIATSMETHFIGKKLSVVQLVESDAMFEPVIHTLDSRQHQASPARALGYIGRLFTIFQTKKKSMGRMFEHAKYMAMRVNYNGSECVHVYEPFGHQKNTAQFRYFTYKKHELILSISVESLTRNNPQKMQDANSQPKKINILKIETRALGANIAFFETANNLAMAMEDYFLHIVHVDTNMVFKYNVLTSNTDFYNKTRDFLIDNLTDVGTGEIQNFGTPNAPAWLRDDKDQKHESENFASSKMVGMFPSTLKGDSPNQIFLSHAGNFGADADKRNIALTFRSLQAHYVDIDTQNTVNSGYGFFYWEDMLVLLTIYTTRNANNERDGHVRLYILSHGHRLTVKELTDVCQKISAGIISNSDTASAKKKVNVEKKEVLIKKYNDGDWKNYTLDKKTFDTIYLPSTVEKRIRSEVENFLALQKLYYEIQVPFKKGILLYGPPGTGKTSVVKALAYEYQLPVHSVNVNDPSINDDTIVDVLNSLGNLSAKILLFEDIDTAFADKEKLANETRVEHVQENHSTKTDEKADAVQKKTESETLRVKESTTFLTYSGLLNALDGVMSNQSGVITIMTTNYIDRLGQAFLRPGRIDAKIELGCCTHESVVKMTRSLISKRLSVDMPFEIKGRLPDIDAYASLIDQFATNVCKDDGTSRVRPCELQNYLMSRMIALNPIFDEYVMLLDSIEPFVQID